MGSHERSIAIITAFPDLCNACCPVGFEDQGKDFREEVIEFLTIHRVGEFFAFGAACISLFHATGSYFTPGCFFIIMAAWAGF
jgi:hypothetical protein